LKHVSNGALTKTFNLGLVFNAYIVSVYLVKLNSCFG